MPRPTRARRASRITWRTAASPRAITSRSTSTTAPSTSRACLRRSSCARSRSTSTTATEKTSCDTCSTTLTRARSCTTASSRRFSTQFAPSCTRCKRSTRSTTNRVRGRSTVPPSTRPRSRPRRNRGTAPDQVVDSLDLHRRGLPACPFMHGTAHWMAFGTLYSGGTVVISPERHFDPEHLWRLIEAEQVTFLVIVGDAFARPLIETFDELDPPVDATPLTVVLSGGAVLSPSVKAAWVDRLPGTLLIDGFGASETGGQGQSVSAAGGPIESVARFHVNDETTVLGDDLRPVAPGVIGKLARRGHVPLGYYKDQRKTAD